MNTKHDKMIGSFVGLAIGDALGVPLEFKRRDTHPFISEMIGQGPFNLNPGEWTDDTSMALCIADSLCYNKGFDAIDIMTGFCEWWKVGLFSHNHRCFDIGITTQAALQSFMDDTSDPYKGSTNPNTSGNGSIMRLAPIPIFYHNDLEACVKYSIEQSRLTHASHECLETCADMGELLWRLYNGEDWDKIIPVNKLFGIPRHTIKSTGYVIDTYRAALWAISNTDTFEDALTLAVNLADDSDTVGAVTGQLAGAKYGYSAIPERWLEKLVWKDRIEDWARELIQYAPDKL